MTQMRAVEGKALRFPPSERTDDRGVTIARPGNIDNHTATRRGILTGLATLPAVALAGSAVIAAPLSAPASGSLSPVMAAIAANRMAEDRFSNLPADLERESPFNFQREERRMHDAWDALKGAEPRNWAEFIAQLATMTDEGEGGLDEGDVVSLLRRARRLERAA